MKIPDTLKENKVMKFIVILYSVGVVGTILPFTRGFFIFLTPFVLLLSIVLLGLFHAPRFDRKTIFLFSVIFLASFAVEVVGVNTGKIFGSYSYGKGLGLIVMGTPLLIGLNWVFLVYCTSAIVENIPVSPAGKIAGASLLMVAYDLVMEQVAPLMDMWTFEGGTAPFRNYVSWFVFSLIFHALLRISGVRIINRLAPLLFWCQGIFFLLIFIFHKITG